MLSITIFTLMTAREILNLGVFVLILVLELSHFVRMVDACSLLTRLPQFVWASEFQHVQAETTFPTIRCLAGTTFPTPDKKHGVEHKNDTK